MGGGLYGHRATAHKYSCVDSQPARTKVGGTMAITRWAPTRNNRNLYKGIKDTNSRITGRQAGTDRYTHTSAHEPSGGSHPVPCTLCKRYKCGSQQTMFKEQESTPQSGTTHPPRRGLEGLVLKSLPLRGFSYVAGQDKTLCLLFLCAPGSAWWAGRRSRKPL